MNNSPLYAQMAKLVLERSGLNLPPEKYYLLNDRLAPIAKRHHFTVMEKFLEHILTKGNERYLEEVIEALMTHESSFFRDAAPFEEFRKVLLPYFREHRAQKKKLRIWSAACSSGQEAFSLAIEWFEAQQGLGLQDWKLEILGTDYSNHVLKQAKEGLYSGFEVQRGLSEHLMYRYFHKEGAHWRVQQKLRDLVTFRNHNLLEPLSKEHHEFDIIFCRNVLIYFTDDLKRKVLHHLRNHLANDGVLITGSAEDPSRWDGSLKKFQHNSCYYKK